MKVKLKKKHQSWDLLYPGELNVGDELELSNKIVTNKKGKEFLADEMCKSFGCSYQDIFKKVEV